MTGKSLNHLHLFIILGLGFFLTGCALNRPYPEKSSYLPDVSFEVSNENKPLPFRIKVRNTRVTAPFEGKAFVYRLPEGQWETDFYNEWFAYPRDLVTENCIAALARSNKFAAVTSEDSLIDADYYLEGALIESYLDRRNPKQPESVIKTRWVLIPNKPGLMPTLDEGEWKKVYEERQSLGQDTPNAYSEASALGLGNILNQLVSDLSQHLDTAHP